MNALRRRLKPSPQKPSPQKSGDPQTSQTTLPQAAPSALSSAPVAVLPPPPPKAPELPKTTERPKTTDRKFRTKTHRGTLAPQFNETFVEEGVLGSFLSGPLQAKVLDHDAISFDDSLGTLELSLEALRGQDELELSKCKLSGVPHGTLSMVVSWTASGATDGPRDEQIGSLSVPNPDPDRDRDRDPDPSPSPSPSPSPYPNPNPNRHTRDRSGSLAP